MEGDGLYLTTYEGALAVVATSMKKARLLLDTLIINSFIGGIFFTTGGMLHIMIFSECPQIYQQNPGIVYLLQGIGYPIGLFFVVIMGVDLFNSNILFFSVGVARGAVSILDLLISWFVSWWVNLVGNIFVCYVICNFSSVSSLDPWVEGSIAILNEKLESNFVETLLKSMAGNFFVCLAIYMQLMAKPIHVKLLLLALPVFTFVSLRFTHSIADMFMIIIGLINGAPTSVGTVAWKLFLPGALGNIIGGSFFSLLVPFYLHIIVVERDRKKLGLPKYDMRDEQPDINQDSRVVRGRMEDDTEDTESDLGANDEVIDKFSPSRDNDYLSDGVSIRSPSTMSRKKFLIRRSPSNVFPVYGMGSPGERERSIASGFSREHDKDSVKPRDSTPSEHRNSATFMGENLLRTLSRTQSKRDDRNNLSNFTFTNGRQQGNRTPQNITDSNSYFSRVASNSRTRPVQSHDSMTPSEVAPEAIREDSAGESNSPQDSAFTVNAFDPADQV